MSCGVLWCPVGFLVGLGVSFGFLGFLGSVCSDKKNYIKLKKVLDFIVNSWDDIGVEGFYPVILTLKNGRNKK